MADEWVTDWWHQSRKAWGRLQQVRRSTRVRCPMCMGRRGSRQHCEFCTDGYVDRDRAVAHYETEMDFACKYVKERARYEALLELNRKGSYRLRRGA